MFPDPLERALLPDRAPSMLDLVRLSTQPQLPPGGLALGRQIALLTDMKAGDDVLDVACGRGALLEHFVREYDVHGAGVDADATMVEQANERARELGLQERLQFQHALHDDLPYRDGIFDVVIGELGLAARADPASAVAELVRVTKPGGRIVLVQLVWLAHLPEDRQRVLASHLGARPLMLVEWKRLLRDAGLRKLHTEDWTDEETAFRPRVRKPFPDFAELFTVPEKLGILRRARRRWGWRGVRAAMVRELEVHRLLTRERILGLDLVKGVKESPEPPRTPDPPGGGEARGLPEAGDPESGTPPRPHGPAESASGDERVLDEETSGLPLFGSPDGRS